MQPARWIDRGDSDQMRHHARTSIVTASVAAVLAVGAPAQAFSGGGTTNDNGYGARVEVHLSGDVSQGAVASVPGPPPMCWWETSPARCSAPTRSTPATPRRSRSTTRRRSGPTSPGTPRPAQLAIPTEAYFKYVIAQVKAGQPMTFYSLQIRDQALGVPGSPEYATSVRTDRPGVRHAGHRRSLRPGADQLAGLRARPGAAAGGRARGPRGVRLRGDGPQAARAWSGTPTSPRPTTRRWSTCPPGCGPRIRPPSRSARSPPRPPASA